MYNLIPTETSSSDLLQMFAPLLIGSIAIGILILVAFIYYAVRTLRVQTAILKTQQDVSEIRDYLLNKPSEKAISSTEPVAPPAPASPSDINQG